MINTRIDSTQFLKDMTNIANYSLGFVEGVKKGQPKLLKSFGETIKQYLEEFIDSSARIDPQTLHHVYEWYQTGSADARLFDIKFVVTGSNIHFSSDFRQSKSVQDGSNIPFFNKASVMESGISVTISPRNSDTLVFENQGQTIFSKTPVTVDNPGGIDVQNAYHEIFNMFFQSQLSQSFLLSSGMIRYIETPKAFDTSFAAGKKGGKPLGIEVGEKWISEAGVI